MIEARARASGTTEYHDRARCFKLEASEDADPLRAAVTVARLRLQPPPYLTTYNLAT